MSDGRRAVLDQKLHSPIAQVPYSDSAVMRGGYKESAVGREAEGIDGISVSFESTPYVFRGYFPDLKDEINR